MGKPLQLRYDPLQVFVNSKTPAGLYARQKWRHEESKKRWASDFNETVKALRADQLLNGSWNNSELNTIQRLFSLHLTVREPDDSIQRGIDWLLSYIKPPRFPMSFQPGINRVCNHKINEIEGGLLNGLPFTKGCLRHLTICAVLFLANCFGRGEERRITEFYDSISREIEAKNGCWCSVYCTSNVMRAFVTHTRYSRSKAAAMMVNYLGQHQLPSGRWIGRTPFYMTFNALAHLNSVKAKRQCMAATENVLKTQNKDGSWGRTQKEWNTFLVVHALKKLNA
jgi:hypothetical protein